MKRRWRRWGEAQNVETVVKENGKDTRNIEETMDRLMNHIKDDLRASRKEAQKKKSSRATARSRVSSKAIGNRQ